MANTKSIGEISEAIVMAEFLKAGFPVLLPFGDNRRYDMVVRPGKPGGRCCPGANPGCASIPGTWWPARAVPREGPIDQ
jgi:hypothetical protein